MADTTDYARWSRRETIRTTIIGGLAGALALLSAVVVVLVVETRELSEMLHERTPVIERIDRAEHEAACVQSVEAAFLSAVGDMLIAATGPERNEALMQMARDRVVSQTAVVLQLAETDVDPCTLIPLSRGEP